MVALAWHVHQMTVADFLEWDSGDFMRYELVDGEPRMMPLQTNRHGLLKADCCGLIGNHIEAIGRPCMLLCNPGIVPDVLGRFNYRIPDLGVSYAKDILGKWALPEPALLVEIMSPNKKAATWSNVWTYTTVPTVQEVLVLHTSKRAAELLRRSPEGGWPDQPLTITSGDIELNSIDFRTSITELYAQTGLPA